MKHDRAIQQSTRSQILRALNRGAGQGLTAKQVWRRIGMWAPSTIRVGLTQLYQDGLVERQDFPPDSPNGRMLPSLWWIK